MNDLKEINISAAPILIAGPCSAESREQLLATAAGLAPLGIDFSGPEYGNPAPDPAVSKAMALLPCNGCLRSRKVIVCASLPKWAAPHAELALENGVDLLWIGARTSASPFAVQEIADTIAGTDVPVLVKNPVCTDLDLWIGAVERLYMRGVRRLGAIHRGFKTPGDTLYRNSPLWEIADDFRREMPDLPMICDPSHMGGARKLVEPLARAALRRGYNGLIIESHHSPDNALTDAAQQITPEALAHFLPKRSASIL